MTPLQILSSLIIVATLIGVAIGRWPWLRMNRATIALTGATALIVIGAIPLEDAYASLDLDTLTLLFAMMIINYNLRRAGFSFPNPTQAWLTLAMSTTMAGNLTLLGSVANLIVTEIAFRRNVNLSFTEYLRAGPLITVISLTLGILWLTFVFA